MRLLWLADALRSAGLRVIETSGWRARGKEYPALPDGVIGHHTASNRKSGNLPSVNLCINGRPDLKGPLCSLVLGRDGSWATIASGIGNHAGIGSYPGISGNSDSIGVEAENDGIGEPWPIVQIESYVRGVAALLSRIGQTEARFCGHFEFARPSGRKIDPRGPWVGGGDWYSGGAPRAGWNAGLFRERLREIREGDDMFSDEDRALVKETRDLLLQFFGLNDDGTARDIRAKIDANYIALYGADHRELPAGRIVAIDRTVNAGAP